MGAATPVKNREQYDSCWACATTSFPEVCDEFIVTDNMSPLSEQQLVECDPIDSTCNGGFIDNEFAFAVQKAMCTEVSSEQDNF